MDLIYEHDKVDQSREYNFKIKRSNVQSLRNRKTIGTVQIYWIRGDI